MDMEDSQLGGLGNETIYGTHEDNVVVSEKVQSLAGSIYQEFERMIVQYDEDVVKTLMPLTVNLLECLDAAYQSNSQQDVDLELLREDNEQLVTQYSREKSGRKAAEEKLLQFEDASEGERKEYVERQDALENIVKMLELKNKNSMEHTSRLEEREGELKKEYNKLHERYTDLFKTHMDYSERTKLLLSGVQLTNDRSDSGRMTSNRLNMGRSSGPVSFGFASLENAEGVDSVPTSPISSSHSSPSLHSEMDNVRDAIRTVEKGLSTDTINHENKSVITSPISPQMPQQVTNNNMSTGRVHTKKEERSGNNLYQELSFQDADALADMDDGADITGVWVHPGEYASSVNDNFYGMGKEVENLIMENNELLATKNALNVVKDDLIVQVDALSGEMEMLREEILSLNVSRTRFKERVAELEDELKKLKKAHESRPDSGEEESEVPMAQRKRFTRVEMARVLMERNQYKERFMELQEAVRWSELVRATKGNPDLGKENKHSIWKFFSNLFSGSDRPTQSMMQPQLRYKASTNQVMPGVRALPRSGQDFHDTEIATKRAGERREQYRHVRAHVRKEDGRLQAYGWSLPEKVAPPARGPQSSSGGVPVPVPVYCRPLVETSSGMKIWCAAGVNLMGGYTKDGGLMVGGSVFYSDDSIERGATLTELDSLDKEINSFKEGAMLETKLSSLVWICTSTQAASIVTVLDANNPAEVLNSFGVCTNHLLCIASVPGASVSDYGNTNYIPSDSVPEANENSAGADAGDDAKEESDLLGRIVFVDDNPTVKNRKDQVVEASEVEEEEDGNQTKAEDEEAGDANDTTTSSGDEPNVRLEVMSSVLATMWLGAQNGELFVHSAVSNWNQCLHSVKLPDAVLSIVHVNGRVVVALANGTMAVFSRDETGDWDLGKYNIVHLGLPKHSLRCLAVVGDKVWCSYRNKVCILEPMTLKIVHTLVAHPRKESQVRQLAWLGDGVWLSVRLDSTLRLYHAQTYEHLQDVDIEPYVSKMLGTGKLGFSLVRISALLISSNRLWIGTSNGVIISVPLSESGSYSGGTIVSRASGLHGSGVRLNNISGNIPFCNVAHAQLSFHGHRDSVKYFVAVPGNGGMSAASTPSEAHSAAVTPIGGPQRLPPAAMLVMSGGEGYIDFRIGDSEMEESVTGESAENLEKNQGGEAMGAKSHLIVWQVAHG
ncbi:PREDICTED: JNK-interacting protein 3 isoform X2 [Nicrophorus vespilloides]|uniref:JNK-interacting protein 3 isoform X2 n=1 Tax=Nicrophorus vespilloides TaxID=110193 RepID=A0ABM1N9P1_NICVS|nr:PREDICTED: JNK-interacting protein 3 isoform X2 [Nicrophorus vespilloides]